MVTIKLSFLYTLDWQLNFKKVHFVPPGINGRMESNIFFRNQFTYE